MKKRKEGEIGIDLVFAIRHGNGTWEHYHRVVRKSSTWIIQTFSQGLAGLFLKPQVSIGATV
jgi:hypothetical protein